MNPDTRVAVCCYEGDCSQVVRVLGTYLHHQCPVVVLSPGDSKSDVRYPGVEQRYAGKRAYVGQDSLDRQRKHLMELLTFPERFFLVHDADSVCLSPKLPEYLYEEPDVLWSNYIDNTIPSQQEYYLPGFPKIAFQPPYFLSRKTIVALLAVADGITMNPGLPFIDHYMVQLAVKAGWAARGFPDGASLSTEVDYGIEDMAKRVREGGKIFLHSIKSMGPFSRMLVEREKFLKAAR